MTRPLRAIKVMTLMGGHEHRQPTVFSTPSLLDDATISSCASGGSGDLSSAARKLRQWNLSGRLKTQDQHHEDSVQTQHQENQG
jgi:hypothetical protein